MPIRTASVTKKISANGQALHRAAMRRMEAGGADTPPSEAESALIEERRALKEERDKRNAQALQPRPSALERMVRTHHPQAKEKVRAETHEAKETKKPKPRRSRAEKHAEKAAALEAARRSPKKPAK
jgi:acetoin utilization deacetylase AcuC-like enzyme